MKHKIMVGVFIFSMYFVQVSHAGQTINTREVQGFFYADGKMEKSAPQFEITYFVDGDKITRTRVYDFKNKQIFPDDTVYQIQRQYISDPYHPTHQAEKALGVKDVIRAVGEPGTDALETIVITEKTVTCYKSTSDYMVISRYEII